MNILFINTFCSYGSTGSICEELASELEIKGHNCIVAYGQYATTYSKVYKIGTKFENHLHNLLSRVLGTQGYFSKRGTEKLIDFIANFKPDVIHLHNLHGNYLNLNLLFTYLQTLKIPIFWTLHDCWAFTGKCAHYTDIKCYKWQSECGGCPQVKKYPPSLFFDKSKMMFRDKKKLFNSLQNLHVISVSNWLKNEVSKSYLQNHSQHMIYNWTDDQIFKPNVSNDISLLINEKKSKFTILAISGEWLKGITKFDNLIKLSFLLDDTHQIIVVGKNKNKKLFNTNCVFIDYVHSSQKLAELYSCADVYVHLSVEDTFGKVVTEAMSCGTPAIVFDQTALPELIGRNCGYVVRKNDIEAMTVAIEKVKILGKSHFSESAWSFVELNFNSRINIDKTIQLIENAV